MPTPEAFPEQQLRQPLVKPVPETESQSAEQSADDLGHANSAAAEMAEDQENGVVNDLSFSSESREHFYEHSVASDSKIESGR